MIKFEIIAETPIGTYTFVILATSEAQARGMAQASIWDEHPSLPVSFK